MRDGFPPVQPYWAVLKIPTIRWIIVTGALFNFNSYACDYLSCPPISAGTTLSI